QKRDKHDDERDHTANHPRPSGARGDRRLGAEELRAAGRAVAAWPGLRRRALWTGLRLSQAMPVQRVGQPLYILVVVAQLEDLRRHGVDRADLDYARRSNPQLKPFAIAGQRPVHPARQREMPEPRFVGEAAREGLVEGGLNGRTQLLS